QFFSLLHHARDDRRVHFWRRRRCHAQQLIIAGNQVSVFAQVADDQFRSLSDSGAHRERSQLPHQVIGQIGGLGKEILKRRALDFFHLTRRAISGIQVLLEKGAKIDFFERIFFLRGRKRRFFGGRRDGTIPVFFAAVHIVQQWNGVFQFLKVRVLYHLGIDHVLELKLIERKHTDHLYQSWGQDLSLRNL